MPLADDIWKLRDRTHLRLVAAHDYFADSVYSWGFLTKSVAGGAVFSHCNAVTGSITTPDELVARSKIYVKRQLIESNFNQIISIFEYWFFDLLRLWLLAYPRNLANKQLLYKDVLDAPDKEAIGMLMADKELNEVTYKRPAEWFVYLRDRTNIACPSADEMECFSEAKAARDAMVHNQGIAGKIYLQKSGARARFKDGDIIDITEPYHREVWMLTLKLVADISNAVALKAV